MGFGKWLFVYVILLLIVNFIVMVYIVINYCLNLIVLVNDLLVNCLLVIVLCWVDVLYFNFLYYIEYYLFFVMSFKYYLLVKEKIKEMWLECYYEMLMIKVLVVLWNILCVYY